MNINIKDDRDPFWFNDITVLYKRENLTQFFPSTDSSMSDNEKLNAIMRFGIYIAFILFFSKKSIKVMFIPLGIALVTLYIFRYNNVQSPSEKSDEFTDEDTCQMPTKDNPFMNALLTDIGTYKVIKPACKIESDEVKEQIEEHFNAGLYKDVGDLYEKGNSQRQFFTMPSREFGPKMGDTGKFANWLFNKGKPTCKEDSANCADSTAMFWDDLRRNREQIPEQELKGN